jgi:CBS domain-containing protein
MEQTARLLTKKVIAVPSEVTVADAARVMKKANIGAVLVGDPERPEGIFTERDVARRVVAEGLNVDTTRVSEVMTRKLVTVEATDPLEKVFECLGRGQFRHLPITENGRVVGIVSLTDVAKMLRELASDEKFLAGFADEANRPRA